MEKKSFLKNKLEIKNWQNTLRSKIQEIIKPIFADDRLVFINSLFLVGTTVFSGIFGFIFWMIAARKYSTVEIGIGAAYINLVTLIAFLGDMGLAITMIRYIVGLEEKRRIFINTTIIIEGFISFLLCLLFVAGMPFWSQNLSGLYGNLTHLTLFIASVVSFLLANFLDNIYLAFNKPHLLFWRNFLAGLIRVIFLLVTRSISAPVSILMSVGLGAFLTLVLSLFIFLPRTIPSYFIKIEFSFNLVRERITYALSNYFSQLLSGVTPLLYPLIIIRILGPQANAQFYICWMVSSVLFIIPVAIATSAFAKISRTPDLALEPLWRLLRITLLGLSIVIPFLILIDPWILSIFGEKYQHASSLLFWLILSALPYSVTSFVVTYYRLSLNIYSLLLVSGIPALLSVLFMTFGGKLWGIAGLGIGWFFAQFIGALLAIFWLLRQSRLVSNTEHESQRV